MMRRQHRVSGSILGSVLQSLLLAAVLGQVVYLAASYRLRIDTTAEGLYTLSDSTRRVLGRLEDRLLIEAYFSPDRDLTQSNRIARDVLRGFLDELVQEGGGKVQVQYLDPATDRELRDRAVRLGIRPAQVSDRSERSLSLREFWQGLRLRYGGERQEVLAQFAPRSVPALYEAELTPIIKALTVVEKPRIGVIAYPTDPLRRGQKPFGYGLVFGSKLINSRYQMEGVKFGEGQPIPETYETILLVRPRALTDKQKLSLDQFLMRGGQLVVFADTDDFVIGPQRLMRNRPWDYDAPGSKLAFVDQLAVYGVRLRPETAVELTPSSIEGQFAMVFGSESGQPSMTAFPYPHFMRPLAYDWNRAEARAQLARGDAEFARQLEGRFGSGLAAKHPLASQFVDRGGPAMFWPVAMELGTPVPAGVDATIVMQTTPQSVAVVPSSGSFDPTGGAQEPAALERNLKNYTRRFQTEYRINEPKQFALMVELQGSFRSAFDGRPIPGRADAKEGVKASETDAGGDPLEEPPGADPLEGLAEQLGPPVLLPDGDEPDLGPVDVEPILLRAVESARLVVLADSDFIRDDLVRGDYQKLGGPVSSMGGFFVLSLLDWLAQDDDLVALRSRGLADRRLQLVDQDRADQLRPERYLEAVSAAQTLWRSVYMVLPPSLLLVLGVVLGVRRAAAKRRFLRSVG